MRNHGQVCRYVDELPERVLSVLGAHTIGIQGNERIALMALAEEDNREQPHSREVKFVDALFRSDDPLIRRCLEDGLPDGVYGKLCRTVKCDGCGAKLNIAPCPTCAEIVRRKEVQERDDRGQYLPKTGISYWREQSVRLKSRETVRGGIPSRKTNAEPGGDEKIEIMRRRVERGESPCHPKDKRREMRQSRVELAEVSTEFVRECDPDFEWPEASGVWWRA